MKKADDNTIMEFGSYIGKELANVPASYLIWCHKNIFPRDYTYSHNKHIFEYIQDNLEDLKEEAKRDSQ